LQKKEVTTVMLNKKLQQTLPSIQPGWVWLAGAGPGDVGLLTLLCLQGLQQADVIVYDALVGDNILALAREDAAFEYAGKRGGRPSVKQHDICERMVELARSGKRVLRLKGGDPLVFGRGGEEARHLAGAGIPFRIVPGVTAGVGGLAYAGIPATDRHTNSAVTFMTAHGADGGLAKDIDWDALVKASPFLVIYMGLSRVGQIADKLREAGLKSSEAVAVVSRASMIDQKVLETTLGECADDVSKAGLKAPALLVIGENIKLRQGLDWLGAIFEGRTLDPDVGHIRPQGKRFDS